MPTDKPARADDVAAVGANVGALAVEAHAVLARTAAGGPGRHRKSLDDLRRRVESFWRALDEGRPEEGRPQDVRLWLDGLRQQALVLRDLNELSG